MLSTKVGRLETVFITIMLHFSSVTVSPLLTDTVPHSVGTWTLVSGKLLGAVSISETSNSTSSDNRNGRTNKRNSSAPTRYRLLGQSQQGFPLLGGWGAGYLLSAGPASLAALVCSPFHSNLLIH